MAGGITRFRGCIKVGLSIKNLQVYSFLNRICLVDFCTDDEP